MTESSKASPTVLAIGYFTLALVALGSYVGTFWTLQQSQDCTKVLSAEPAIISDLSSIKEDLNVLLDQQKCYWNGYSEGLSSCYSAHK